VGSSVALQLGPMAEHPPPPEGLQFWFFALLAHLELF
jgi:hypothetical protein